MALPSLEVLTVPRECSHCGEPGQLADYCASCAERMAVEKIRESSNEYRLQAQIRYDLHEVALRAQRHQASKRAPAQNVCVTCKGRGGFAFEGGQEDGRECPDCDGGVPK